MNFPANLRYTKEHEWAKVDGKIVTIGITDHAQSALGDIVFVELPKPGRMLKLGETFGVVESIKAVSDLYAPCSGKVLEINTALTDEPGLLNKDPYSATNGKPTWMIKVEASAPGEIDALMDAETYKKHCATLGT